MTALYLADQPSAEVRQEMARRCAIDSGIHWYGEQPVGIDLWLPGQSVREPADDPEREFLRPYLNYQPDTGFLATGIARALYVQIDPTNDYYFGPGPADGPGTYRFTMLDEGDPGCAAWIAYTDRRATPGAAGYRRSDGQCVAWDKVGPLDASRKPNEFLRFEDTPARRRGLYRDGGLLTVAGKQRARFTMYRAINPSGPAERAGNLGIEACQNGRIGTPAILGPDEVGA